MNERAEEWMFKLAVTFFIPARYGYTDVRENNFDFRLLTAGVFACLFVLLVHNWEAMTQTESVH